MQLVFAIIRFVGRQLQATPLLIREQCFRWFSFLYNIVVPIPLYSEQKSVRRDTHSTPTAIGSQRLPDSVLHETLILCSRTFCYSIHKSITGHNIYELSVEATSCRLGHTPHRQIASQEPIMQWYYHWRNIVYCISIKIESLNGLDSSDSVQQPNER